MNNVKFYKRTRNGGIEVQVFRVRQHKVRWPSTCPHWKMKARKTLPQITVEMEKKGYSRKRLYIEMDAK